MKPLTFASICTSGGVFEQGVISNGVKPIWGIEINPRVAEVYRLNYPDSQIIINDACKVDWATLPRPDFLHASPSCRSFSGLNNKSEAAKDMAVAQAIAKAIAHFKPDIFTLENVPKYQDSESWTIIFHQLKYLGYSVSHQVHRLKFWGVPQKQRNRFIAIATLNQPAIQLLTPNRTTHWYEEIEDLIPDLEPSELTQTQIDKLTSFTKFAIANKQTVLLKRNQIRSYTPAAYSSEPYCWSPTATLCTDQNENKRSKFADLVTPNGILKLNVRCLARIQTIPDAYILPEDIAIAGLVVGDAIPPLFSKQMWEQILQQYSPPLGKAKNGYLQTKQIKRGGKIYTEHYYRYYQDGIQRSQYVKNALISRVEKAIAHGKSIIDILILLRGVENLPPSPKHLNKESGENPRPLSKTQRKLGEGTGYIICKPIKRNNKTYNQYWFCYEVWSNGKCRKKSKYIPKKKVGKINQLNADKMPVSEILTVLVVL